MEIDPDTFEKLNNVALEEEKKKITKSKDAENKWARLEQRFGS